MWTRRLFAWRGVGGRFDDRCDFCTVDGVDMKVGTLVQSIIKKVSFSLGKTAVVRIGMGWDGDEKDAAAAAAAATTAERSERGK